MSGMWLARDSGARSLATGVAFGIAALALDIAAVLVSNSAALRADLVRGGADTAAAVFALLIYYLSRNPARSGLQLRKLTDLSCVLTAAAIIAGVVCMMWVLADRMAHPVIIQGTMLGFIVAVLYLVCNVWLLALNRSVRKPDQSPLIDVQARVIRTKLLANLTLFATIGGATFGPGATAQFLSDSAGVLTQSAFGIWTAAKLLRLHGHTVFRTLPFQSGRRRR
jgi:divalent metal cation (Fe/Co/Zn/Cd) transporter